MIIVTMLRHFVTPVLVSLIVAVLTVITWQSLELNGERQVAQIAEAESYAARSRLIRDIETFLRAVRDVHKYWSTYAHLSQDQWVSDAGIELGHFAGLDVLLWSDSGRSVRFARTSKNPVLNYRPTDEEWKSYESLLERVKSVRGEAVLGPFPRGDDSDMHEFYVVFAPPDESGTIIAVVNAHRTLENLLADSSPGYALSVSWNDTILYQRGEAGRDVPESWRREGLIRNSMDVLWKVTHVPTASLAETMTTPAIKAVLVSGLLIAALLGLLLFENGRARRRAAAAEFAEKQVSDLNRGLEQQVTDRTKELAGRTTDLLTITESVGHDLRNPLNSISTNTQLLELKYGSMLGEDGATILNQTTINVRRMTEILDRLLGFSMISNASFGRHPLDMKRFAAEIVEELQSSEQDRSVIVDIEDLPEADADPTMVRILLMNLLSNALKYSRQQEVRNITVGSVSANGACAYFVRDNGSGFDEAVADRLFQAFARMSHDGEADGLGLGLHIASRVVKRHGGRIWAESNPGDGATFYFTLEPAADAETAYAAGITN